MSMRFPWEGRLRFEGVPEIEHIIRHETTLSNFLEAIEHNVIPRYQGDAGERWSIDGLPRERNGIHVQGAQYSPHPMLDVAAGVLRDWIRYGLAGIERNVLEGSPPLPAVMELPGWSLTAQGDDLYQQEGLEGEASKRISRGRALHPPAGPVDAARSSLWELMEVAEGEKQALSVIPQAIRGQGPVKPLEALDRLSLELLKVTGEIGYVPQYCRVDLTPEYRFSRSLRLRRWGMTVRRSLLSGLNDALSWFAQQDGLGERVVISFEEAWTRDELDRLERGVREGTVDVEAALEWLWFGEDPWNGGER